MIFVFLQATAGRGLHCRNAVALTAKQILDGMM